MKVYNCCLFLMFQVTAMMPTPVSHLEVYNLHWPPTIRTTYRTQ